MSKIITSFLVAAAVLVAAGISLHEKGHISQISDYQNSKVLYEMQDSDALFQVNRTTVDELSAIYVVLHNDSLTVITKGKNKDTALVYPGLRNTAFNSFYEEVLKDVWILSDGIDHRYLNSYVGLGEKIGLPLDPTYLIYQSKLSKATTGLRSILFFVFLIGALIFVLIFTQKSVNTNSTQKVMPDAIDDDIDDLIGMEDIKQELQQLKEMASNRKLYEQYGLNKPFNVMLTGPAGTGKTKIARCLAKDLNVPLFYASASSLETGFVAGGAKTLKSIYKKASRHKRAIIFLDEAESIMTSRDRPTQSRYENDTMTTLLSLLDGVNSTASNGVIWIVASNYDEHTARMDEAMLRRFHLKINFRLPNQRERLAILDNLISQRQPDKLDADINLEHISNITAGMSPATLETLVSRASLIAVQRSANISQDVLIAAFERQSVGITDRSVTGDLDVQRRIIAIHEAGHFIAHLHHKMIESKGNLDVLTHRLDVLKISTESVAKFGALGYVLNRKSETPLNTRKTMEEKVIELYGGMANEELYYGEAGTTGGAHNDIERATDILTMMYAELGAYSTAKLNLAVLRESGLDSGNQKLMEITNKSEQLYANAIDLLEFYRPLTDAITFALMDQYTLNLNEICRLVKTFFTAHPDVLDMYRQDKRLQKV